MPGNVFISYATVDASEFAERLRDDLESHGIPTWLDARDVPEGADWDREIDKALQGARAVLVILTPGAVLSARVKAEWISALNRHLSVIPLLFKKCEVPRLLAPLRVLDVLADYDSAITRLTARLQRLDADHLENLKDTVTVFTVAQQEALEPRRFQLKIDSLNAAIAAAQSRIEPQRDRLAAEWRAQRWQFATRRRRSSRRPGIRIGGQRLLDVLQHFKDRERELDQLARLLTAPSTRMVTILGRGGIGKTALACKVLADIENGRLSPAKQIDGIVYLSSRTAGISLERLFLDCGRMLGSHRANKLNAIWANPERKSFDKIQDLLEALGQGQYILLMDNMEDGLDNEGRFRDQDLLLFVESCVLGPHDIRLLFTSRLPVALSRKTLHVDLRVPLLEGLPPAEGVALLREMDPNGAYGLRDSPTTLLEKAVQRTGGIPRALEVIASILANDPFARLTDVLDRFFQHKDVVRDVIEEGYRRLDADARRVLQALAVFDQPVRRLAIDHLLEPFVPGIDVPGILARLARTYMVHINRTDGTATLHPIDRDYAYSQLPDAAGDTVVFSRQALERRAASFYARLRTPRSNWRSIAELEPQLREFEHRLRAGEVRDHRLAAELLNDIDTSHLSRWGHYQRLLSMRHRLSGHLREPVLEAVNLARIGEAYNRIAGHGSKDAIPYLHQALMLARRAGDRPCEVMALGHLGWAYRALEPHEDSHRRGLRLFRKALAVARAIDDKAAQAVWLEELGHTYRYLIMHEEAVACFRRSLAIARKSGHRIQEEWALGQLGISHRHLGAHSTSRRRLEEALRIALQEGDRRGEGVWLTNLAELDCDLANYDGATEYLERAAPIAQAVGTYSDEIYRLVWLAKSQLGLGDAERALSSSLAACTLAEKAQVPQLLQCSQTTIAQVLLHLGKLSAAREAIIASRRHPCPEYEHRAAFMEGLILMRLRERSAASIAFREALDYADRLVRRTRRFYAAQYSRALALAGLALGGTTDQGARHVKRALRMFRAALTICVAQGERRDAKRLLDELAIARASGTRMLEPLYTVLADPHDVEV